MKPDDPSYNKLNYRLLGFPPVTSPISLKFFPKIYLFLLEFFLELVLAEHNYLASDNSV